MSEIVSRRSFLRGTAASMAALGALSLAGCAAPSEDQTPVADTGSWDKEADVVIVGYGFAGACAALAAQQGGSSVIVVEKAPEAGGNSAVSVGTIHTCIRVEDADRENYIQKKTEGAFGTVDDDQIREFIELEQEIPAWLEDDLGMEIVWTQKPADGTYMANLATDDGIANGQQLFAFFENAAKEAGVEVLLSSPATRLVQDPETKEIRGVVVDNIGSELTIKARKGVVLSCGGYENSPEIQANYHFPGIPFVPWGTPYNTGDGLKLAGGVGADLWHFSCFEYAGLAPKKPYEELEDHPVFTMGYNNMSFYGQDTGGSFMLINKAGKRFMNENMGIGHQKTTLPFNQFNEPEEAYVNYPFFFVCDAAVVSNGPLAPVPVYNKNKFTYAAHSPYEWSADNSAEIAKGWVIEGETVEDLAQKIGADPANLRETIEAFNGYAESGVDEEFGRPAETMRAFEGPFYAVECLLSVINTMGGAKRTAHSEVVGLDGSPIPRLYSAGEFGSFNGGVLYILGNIAEAITSGRVAGAQVTALDPWDAK